VAPRIRGNPGIGLEQPPLILDRVEAAHGTEHHGVAVHAERRAPGLAIDVAEPPEIDPVVDGRDLPPRDPDRLGEPAPEIE
jgi:hypothetical protein